MLIDTFFNSVLYINYLPSFFYFILDEDDTLEPLGLCSLDLVLAR